MSHIQAKIEKIDKKPNYTVANLIEVDPPNLPYNDISINPVDKSGTQFPNYFNLKVGDIIEGETWQSSTGKIYLYPPKVVTTGNSGRSGGISKLMDKKAENIKEAQERKSESIAYFNSVNSAIAMYSALAPEEKGRLDQTQVGPKEFLIMWRDWFISEYDRWNSK